MDTHARQYLAHETRALLTRLDRIRPFALSGSMVPAANLSPRAQQAIDRHLARGRSALRDEARALIESLQHDHCDDAQGRFTVLRLRFNSALTQFDLFADALAQRGDRDHGVWMAGLDTLAEDALALPRSYAAPPVVCYLDRGVGAAIRRARTRLPGGGANPVAIVRIPRERMVGSGIASSMVHEVGHQAAALLGLVESLRAEMAPRLQPGKDEDSWRYWDRWISEIVADFWSVLKLGLAGTQGLMGVLGLPRPFVYRVGTVDPHPTPWIRVLLSAAIGQALYPAPDWQRLATLWRSLYPLDAARDEDRRLLAMLDQAMAEFVPLLLAHRPQALRGQSLGELAQPKALSCDALREQLAAWRSSPSRMFAARPCEACAVIGQARADAALSPEQEARWLSSLLTHWAIRHTFGNPTVRAPPPVVAEPTSHPTLIQGDSHDHPEDPSDFHARHR